MPKNPHIPFQDFSSAFDPDRERRLLGQRERERGAEVPHEILEQIPEAQRRAIEQRIQEYARARVQEALTQHQQAREREQREGGEVQPLTLDSNPERARKQIDQTVEEWRKQLQAASQQLAREGIDPTKDTSSVLRSAVRTGAITGSVLVPAGYLLSILIKGWPFISGALLAAGGAGLGQWVDKKYGLNLPKGVAPGIGLALGAATAPAMSVFPYPALFGLSAAGGAAGLYALGRLNGRLWKWGKTGVLGNIARGVALPWWLVYKPGKYLWNNANQAWRANTDAAKRIFTGESRAVKAITSSVWWPIRSTWRFGRGLVKGVYNGVTNVPPSEKDLKQGVFAKTGRAFTLPIGKLVRSPWDLGKWLLSPTWPWAK